MRIFGKVAVTALLSAFAAMSSDGSITPVLRRQIERQHPSLGQVRKRGAPNTRRNGWGEACDADMFYFEGYVTFYPRIEFPGMPYAGQYVEFDSWEASISPWYATVGDGWLYPDYVDLSVDVYAGDVLTSPVEVYYSTGEESDVLGWSCYASEFTPVAGAAHVHDTLWVSSGAEDQEVSFVIRNTGAVGDEIQCDCLASSPVSSCDAEGTFEYVDTEDSSIVTFVIDVDEVTETTEVGIRVCTWFDQCDQASTTIVIGAESVPVVSRTYPTLERLHSAGSPSCRVATQRRASASFLAALTRTESPGTWSDAWIDLQPGAVARKSGRTCSR